MMCTVLCCVLTVFLYTQLHLHHWGYLRSKMPLNIKTGAIEMAYTQSRIILAQIH